MALRTRPAERREGRRGVPRRSVRRLRRGCAIGASGPRPAPPEARRWWQRQCRTGRGPGRPPRSPDVRPATLRRCPTLCRAADRPVAASRHQPGPRPAGTSRRRSVQRPWRRVSPGICSTNVARRQVGSSHRNRRTNRMNIVRLPPAGRSAGTRSYQPCTRADQHPQPGQTACSAPLRAVTRTTSPSTAAASTTRSGIASNPSRPLGAAVISMVETWRTQSLEGRLRDGLMERQDNGSGAGTHDGA